MTPDSTIRRVYRLLERGYGAKEIANRMGVEERTVRRYITDGQIKFGNARNTYAAVARFAVVDQLTRGGHRMTDAQWQRLLDRWAEIDEELRSPDVYARTRRRGPRVSCRGQRVSDGQMEMIG